MATKFLNTIKFPGLDDTYIVNDLSIIAPGYDDTKEYKIGNLLSASGKMYLTINDAPAGTPVTNTEYFEEKSVADIIEMIKSGTITVGESNLANNFDSKMVLTDNSGYLYRTTGGSLEVGEQNRVKKIIGASVPIIQLAKSLDTANAWRFINVNGSITDGVCTITEKTSDSTSNGIQTNYNTEAKPNHVYMFGLKAKKNASGECRIKIGFVYNYVASLLTENYQYYTFLYKPSSFINDMNVIQIGYYRTDIGQEQTSFSFTDVECIDLTQTFGTTVANRLYALEQAQAGTGVAKAKEILVKDCYPYNVTAFTHTKTSGKVNNGFNQFNLSAFLTQIGDPITAVTNVHFNYQVIWRNECNYEGQVGVYKNGFVLNSGSAGAVFVVFYYKDGTSSVEYSTAGLGANNYIKSTSGKIVNYIRLEYGNDGSYNCTNAKMCIYLAWDGERDGEYEPYQEWNYPVQDIELKGILSLDAQDNWVADGDEYLPSGVVDERYLFVEISDCIDDSISSPDIHCFRVDTRTIGIVSSPNNNTLNPYIVIPGFTQLTWAQLEATDNLCYAVSDRVSIPRVSFIDQSCNTTAEFKTKWSGKYILAKLVIPTTSSADSYTELQNDSNWGTEKWIDTRDVPLPVFSTCEYIPDLKAKVETAPESPDEDGDYIMHRENGLNSYGSLSTWLSANGYNKMQDLLPLTGNIENAGGILRHMLKSQTINFGDTTYVNLGSLNWTRDTSGTYPVFYAEITNIMTVSTATEPYYLCSKYASINSRGITAYRGELLDKTICTRNTYNQIMIQDSDYTSADAFKSAMNGVCLAYKKATT